MTILIGSASTWRTMPIQSQWILSSDSYDGHFIQAIAATCASTEILSCYLRWERG